jgi:hypothetical protein
MEDPNDQENNRLRLPRKFAQRYKPPSPKDNTPIILNGNPIDRSDLTPIVEDRIIKDHSAKINLLETPNAVHELFLKDNTNQENFEEEEEQQDQEDHQELEQQNGKHEQDSESDQIEEENEDIESYLEKEQEEMKIQEKNNFIEESIPNLQYRKYNPPFPDQKTVTQSNNLESVSNISNRLAYVESIESTEESASSSQPKPRIMSPTDVNISPDYKFSVNKSPLSKTLVQTQLNNFKQTQNPQQIKNNNPPQNSLLKSTQFTSPSPTTLSSQSPPSPKLVRQEELRTSSSEQRIQTPKPNVSIHSSANPSSQQQQPQDNKINEELIGKAHDCYLKYQILQKSWPEYKFPNLDEKMVYSNPQFIVDTYNKSVERIQIDMDVNQYKIALIIMFLVIEVVCVKFLGLDAGGYTLSQIKAMNRYEKLLIEIGEKRLLTGESSWPPEVRILFIGLLNCGLFILMKYLSSVLGPDLVGYISPIVNGLFSGVLDTSKTASLPDEIPQRQQDITGMLGSVASLAANALSNNGTAQQNNYKPSQNQRASRRPVFRE